MPPRCCGCIVRRALRDGEPPEERARKELVLPVAAALGAFSFCWLVVYAYHTPGTVRSDADPKEIMHHVGMLVGCGVSWVALHGLTARAMLTRALPLSTCEVALAMNAMAVLSMDFSQMMSNQSAAAGDQNYWAFVIVILDILLVIGAQGPAATVIVVITSVYILLRCSVLRWSGSQDGGESSWGENIGWEILIVLSSWAFSSLVLQLDWHFTRGFSTNMREQQRVMARAIAVTERVATAIERYDTDAAAACVAHGGDALPNSLRRAFEGILDNLAAYRQFLPQSVLMQREDDDDGWMSDSGELCSGSPSSSVASGQLGQRQSSCMASEYSGGLVTKSLHSPCQPAPQSPLIALQTTSAASVKLAGRSREAGLSSVARRGSSSTHIKPGGEKSFLRALRRRKVTVVFFNWYDSTILFESLHDLVLTELLQLRLTFIMGCCKRAGALLDHCVCDRYQSSLNGALPCAAHRAGGLLLLLSIRDGLHTRSLRAAFRALAAGADAGAPARVSCAAATGTARCGDVGSDALRRYDILGPVAGAVRAVERAARALGVDALCDPETQNAGETVLLRLIPLRLVSRKEAPVPTGMAERPTELWEPLHEAGADDDPAEADALRELNAAARMYLDGEQARAHAALLGAHRPDRLSAALQQHRDRLAELVARRRCAPAPADPPAAPPPRRVL